MKKNKNLLIIFGSTQGLGAGILDCALRLKTNDLILINRRRNSNCKNPNITNYRIDLAKRISQEKLESLFSFVKPTMHYKNIYLIANAATIEPIKPVGQINYNDINEHFFTNLLNYVIIINEFIKRLSVYKKIIKKILLISSGAADSPHYGLSLYCGSKAGLEMFGRCIFEEQKKLRQIKISSVRPGVIDTKMQQKIRESSRNNFSKVNLYKKLFYNNVLVSPAEAARKIYNILEKNKFWTKPVLDLNNIDD